MLAVLLALVGMAGIDALRDKTPMKPWSWVRPELEWWAQRKTRRERASVAVSVGKVRGT